MFSTNAVDLKISWKRVHQKRTELELLVSRIHFQDKHLVWIIFDEIWI